VTFEVTQTSGLARRGRLALRRGTIDTPVADVVIIPGQSVSFTGSASDPVNHTPFTYLWDFGGGAANQTVEDPGAVTFNSVGTFVVTFRVTDAAGLPDQEGASCHVPRAEALLEVAVVHPGRGPREVEARGAGPA